MRLDVSAPSGEKLRSSVDADPDLAALANATPAQINAWVDANVTSLAAVRRVLKLVLKALVILWQTRR